MSKVRIKVRNYRCFGYEPQEFEIGPGFTALLGINNAGKSALLKMFYELRFLWVLLSQPSKLNVFQKGHSHNFNANGVNDVDEIFNHFTINAPIELHFAIPVEGEGIFEFTLRLTKVDSRTLQASTICLVLNGTTITPLGSEVYDLGPRLRLRIEKDGIVTQKTILLTIINSFFSELAGSIYIPAFRNAVNAGENSQLYDISTGTAFIKDWDNWKVGGTKFARDQITRITADIRKLFDYENLEINASADKTTLRLIINEKSYSLYEIGSGLSQFIFTFATAAVKKPTYIFIDEPELNLHPALQLKFLTSLGSYASQGVIFSTHSIGLARTSAEAVYSITNDGKDAKISPFSATPDYLTLLGELSFSTYQEIGVNSIFFVEGITDIKTMQEFLRKFHKDSKILVLSLGGCDMINGKREAELSEITKRLGIDNIYAWIDSEKESEGAKLALDRAEFLQMCTRLGITCGISERRATENYFTQRAIQVALADVNKSALGPYEKIDATIHWRKNLNWKIAMETTKDELAITDLGAYINEMKC
jgi:ABC-type cobalamin/Fe3+-siderophores transport system ATPase subunit